jgi:hypothetical protein
VIEKLNALDLDRLTVRQVVEICKRHNVAAICNDGRLIGFEREEVTANA